jgi:hypothetical protein
MFVPHGNTDAGLVNWAIGMVAISVLFLVKVLEK